MSSYLWNITAIRSNGRIMKGMSAEILKKGTTGKPNQKEIAEALNQKYNEKIHDSHCGSHVFNFVEVK
jgi:uncharacterized lipoprotein YajG